MHKIMSLDEKVTEKEFYDRRKYYAIAFRTMNK